MKKKFLKLGSLLLLLSVAACDQADQEKDSDKTVEKEVVIETIDSIRQEKHLKQRAHYPIPSPEQTFVFLKDEGVAFDKSLIAPFENYTMKEGNVKEAIHFGVLTADLAYVAAYGNIKLSKQLYDVAHDMRKRMNIERLMKDADKMQNVSKKLNNKDSLSHFADHFYYNTVSTLENTNQADKLALMSVGGWIESMHIILNAVDIKAYNADNKIERRIADQKIAFSNLYTYLKKNKDLDGIENAMSELEPIRSFFRNLKESKEQSSSTKDKKGRLNFSGGTRIHLSAEEYSKLRSLIDDYRNQLTQTK